VITNADYRAAIARFATGVTIVTTTELVPRKVGER
jgi:flavin reductase (DIM6/NTAB) family NADH-FMN oxidoreductase RutF